MSAHLPAPAVVPDFDYATTSEICARAGRQDAERWLWHGYLASANVTLLVGQWKTGKTTLLSVLLARLATGGTLAGQAVRAGRGGGVPEGGGGRGRGRVERPRPGAPGALLSGPV